jgi:hypothetical protein
MCEGKIELGEKTTMKIFKIIILSVIGLVICCVVVLLNLDNNPLIEVKTPSVPEFSFNHFGPCLESSQDVVKSFELGDQQYICADMKTNEPSVYLELHIFTGDKKEQVYVDGRTLTSGPISFAIYPPLPPGAYWAEIRWSRPALVGFEFEVEEK